MKLLEPRGPGRFCEDEEFWLKPTHKKGAIQRVEQRSFSIEGRTLRKVQGLEMACYVS